MTTFTITRTETVRDGVRLTRGEVIELLAVHNVGSANDLEALDDAALLDTLRTAYEEGDSVWEDVYALLENTGWAKTLNSDTDIDLEEAKP